MPTSICIHAIPEHYVGSSMSLDEALRQTHEIISGIVDASSSVDALTKPFVKSYVAREIEGDWNGRSIVTTTEFDEISKWLIAELPQRLLTLPKTPDFVRTLPPQFHSQDAMSIQAAIAVFRNRIVKIINMSRTVDPIYKPFLKDYLVRRMIAKWEGTDDRKMGRDLLLRSVVASESEQIAFMLPYEIPVIVLDPEFQATLPSLLVVQPRISSWFEYACVTTLCLGLMLLMVRLSVQKNLKW